MGKMKAYEVLIFESTFYLYRHEISESGWKKVWIKAESEEKAIEKGTNGDWSADDIIREEGELNG